MDCSPSGSSVHGIFRARILECVAISFSRESSQSKDWTQVSHTAGRLYHLSYQGSHKVEWVAFSRGSSWPRDRTRVSCIAGRLPSEPPGKPHLSLIYLGLKGTQFWSTTEFFSLSNNDILSLINASHLPHTSSCDNQNVTKCPLREECKVSTWKPLIWNDRW